MRPERFLRRLFALLPAIAVLATGCAGYRLGTMLPPDIKSVYVPTFVNRSNEPLLEGETTRATIEEFQKDGSLKVADEQTGDATVKVTLIDFRLDPVAYDKDDSRAVREYRMTILASVSVVRNSDQTVIAQNPMVKGEAVFELLGDLTSSKLRALPTAAEDLAHRVVEKVVEAW